MTLDLVIKGGQRLAQNSGTDRSSCLAHRRCESEKVPTKRSRKRLGRDQKVAVARPNRQKRLEECVENNEQRKDVLELNHGAANDKAKDANNRPPQSIRLSAPDAVHEQGADEGPGKRKEVDQGAPADAFNHGLVAREAGNESGSQQVEWVNHKVVQEPGGTAAEKSAPVELDGKPVRHLVLDGVFLVLFRVGKPHAEEEYGKGELAYR